MPSRLSLLILCPNWSGDAWRGIVEDIEENCSAVAGLVRTVGRFGRPSPLSSLSSFGSTTANYRETTSTGAKVSSTSDQ